VQRQAVRFCVQIPERDVQRAQGTHDGALTALQQGFLIHRLPKALDSIRILADQYLGKQMFYRGGKDRPAVAADVAKADAFDTVGRPDLDQAVVTSADSAIGK